MNEVAYDDEESLRNILVGRSIVKIEKLLTAPYSAWSSETLDSIEFTLDDGTVLEAREADGGCACSNGCWSVATSIEGPTSVITNVEVVEDLEGSSEHRDGYGTLRMFIYTENGPVEAITSEGGDNGYYGWGYHVYVKYPEKILEIEAHE